MCIYTLFKHILPSHSISDVLLGLARLHLAMISVLFGGLPVICAEYYIPEEQATDTRRGFVRLQY